MLVAPGLLVASQTSPGTCSDTEVWPGQIYAPHLSLYPPPDSKGTKMKLRDPSCTVRGC